jgi:tungstate transport system permease protein
MNYITDGFKQAIYLLMSFNKETYYIIYTSLKLSFLSTLSSLFVGVPLGFIIAYYNFRGKKLIKYIVNTLLSMPTVLIGLFVYILISSKGPLGNFNLLFTIKGMALGQFFLVLPLIMALSVSAIENMDKRLSEELISLGASRFQIPLTYLYEAKLAILVIAVTAFGRVFGEVGLSMMVGGNIKWVTRTITTAIALETGKGEFSMSIALGIVLIFIAFLVNFISIYFTENI